MYRKLLLSGLLLAAGALPAAALTLTFDDRTQWDDAVDLLSNFDGGTQTAGTATGFNTSGGLIVTDLQIVGYNITTGLSYELTRANANASQTWYDWGSGTIIRTADKTATNTVYARIIFLNPVNAFGFDFGVGGSGGAPGSVTITAEGLAPVNVTSNQQPQFAFWGVASDSMVFSYVDIQINDVNRYVILDNIARALYTGSSEPPPGPTESETAEPGTLIHLLMGTGLVAFARRRFSRSAPATRE